MLVNDTWGYLQSCCQPCPSPGRQQPGLHSAPSSSGAAHSRTGRGRMWPTTPLRPYRLPDDLCLELTAELSSRHIHSPVPWSRSYRRVHETGRSSYSGRTPEERLHGIRRDTNQQVEKFLVAEETVLSLTALYIAPAGSSEERLGHAASMFFNLRMQFNGYEVLCAGRQEGAGISPELWGG